MLYTEAKEVCAPECIDPVTLSRFTIVRYLDRNLNRRIKRGPGKRKQKKIGIYKYCKAFNSYRRWP